MSNIITAQHITKHFTGHTALDDVSVEIPAGSVYGLLGPNGAGKTTLIRVINRITIPDEGQILFEAGNVTVLSLMDVVNDNMDSLYYIVKELNPKVKEAGMKTVEAFGARSRFFHLEFFCLTEDQEGLGKKGDIIGLEVNMRPSGGYTPDMYNFAHETDVYKIWADMIAFDHSTVEAGEHQFCAFAGLRDGKNFVMSHDDIMNKYGHCMKMVDRIPEVLSGAMGNQMYVATFPTEEEMNTFYKDVTECR